MFSFDNKKYPLLIEDAQFIIKTSTEDEVLIIPKGSILQVKDGQKVKRDEILALYDSSSQYALSHSTGVARVYKHDDEVEIAVYNAKEEQTMKFQRKRLKTIRNLINWEFQLILVKVFN